MHLATQDLCTNQDVIVKSHRLKLATATPQSQLEETCEGQYSLTDALLSQTVVQDDEA
ncbi:hypothetical protein FOCG_00280 [Fusarium oxysporum f. sp. radicis-lycopersici 26381]|uniref:Uncharacterized protein n=3 Tax=Fusarium oxysporum TaxID=5507 RepID=X0MVT6_FUSOX|nr:hypothetical protein FOZG_04776 [Fusarium oxysporum Fo47]EWZ99423.1 hypothetical protein FOWG_03107 [Fusarium oxysporum f. sp. lycopersici MN25]EXA48986.1 hypothetical protein FOVG_02305 [Fusarium oxysporum f. sp. pisi HDV247]EXL61030.1 hypothetical protein FOCG_00280 [Fusarium oxysporum f. sp. radicis-lycopersici 26381]EXM24500.1 hypothetical protein FOTG_08495 [Fusarium oxysporum f. sp. vasinfectum 25433]